MKERDTLLRSRFWAGTGDILFFRSQTLLESRVYIYIYIIYKRKLMVRYGFLYTKKFIVGIYYEKIISESKESLIPRPSLDICH